MMAGENTTGMTMNMHPWPKEGSGTAIISLGARFEHECPADEEEDAPRTLL